MTKHKLSLTRNNKQGFTIVELLIVIVVIAILAAITVLAFTGIQTRAEETKLQADLKNAANLVQKDHALSGNYPTSESTVNENQGFNPSQGTRIQYTSDGSDYCITATSTARQAKTYYISNETGTIQEGICDNHEGPSIGGNEPTGGWSKITAGDNHSCGVTDGTAYCWGRNGYGQLGTGNITNQTSSVAVSGLIAGKTISSVTTGSYHSCAVAGGTAYCWGRNNYGQLGTGDVAQQNLPVAIGGLLADKTITAIATGDYHTCAVADSTAYCWGRNNYGQLGTGDVAQQNLPVAVSGLIAGTTIGSIATGGSHTCAITTSGKAYCWGNGNNGQLGNRIGGQQNLPVAVGAPLASKTVSMISAGTYHSCAISDGLAYCWGIASSGQLGYGGTSVQIDPEIVSGLLAGKTVNTISTGDLHTCAIADGEVYCWGSGANGRLGNGSTGLQFTPVAIGGLLAGKTATAIDAGDVHSCAVANGTAYCWGEGFYGALGDGSTVSHNTPMLVSPIE